MAVMMTELYDALLAAGAPDDKARAAAQGVADYEARFAKIEGDLKVLKWMGGMTAAGVAAAVLRLYL